jgi:hypothetical protein
LEQVAYKISGFEDKTDIKENTWMHREKIEELWKEYARALNSIKRPNPMNHGHWRRRRGVSQRYKKNIQ